MAKRFPNITYGMKPGSTAEQKAYPQEWKRYFFKTLKSLRKTRNGKTFKRCES